MPRASVRGGIPARAAAPMGTETGRAAFALAMRRLAEVEALPVYAELCAEYDAKVRAAGAKVTDHGWGEYGACGDPRKRRTAS